MSNKSRKVSAAVAAVEGRVFEYVETRMIDPSSLKVAKLATDPFFDPTDRHELAVNPEMLVSVLARGVVQPIIAAENGGALWIIDGRQRAATAVAARRPLVPVTVYKVEGYSKLEVERLILEMNTLKQGVEAIKASRVAKQWIDAGLSRKEAAASMSVSESAFDAFLAIANAPEVVKAAVENNVLSPSAVTYLPTDPVKAEAVIERAQEIRADINAQNPGKAGKLQTKVSNLDVRTAVAESEGKELPKSAARATDKPKADKAAPGPRTGGFNRDEIGAFKEKLEAALVRSATDKEASVALKGALAALSAVLTGDAGAHGDKCPAALREAVAAVRA